MKTEPTEACKMIEESWYAIPYMGVDYPQDPDIVVDKEDVYEIAKKAFQEGQSSPKIKQLEWKETNYYIEARTKIGKYLTMSSGTSINFELRVQMYFCGTGEIVFNGTLGEAKEAAQRDFEQRIKECLL